MVTGGEVLRMLLPLGGWVIYGDDYDSIIWVDERPRCTKEDFQAGFAQYDAWKVEQDAAKAAQKAALLDRLGLTQQEFNTLTA